jgi:hypothetical protein
MAAKTLHVPGWGDWEYDDDSGSEIMSTDGVFECDHTPAATKQVLRYDDVIDSDGVITTEMKRYALLVG